MLDEKIAREFEEYIANSDFPCVAAKAAINREQVKCFVVDHMACPKDDFAILEFLNDFTELFRNSPKAFHSAAVIFKGPQSINEAEFDRLLWQRLQSLSDLDARRNNYDKRVDPEPASANFSFSINKEAFFVIGLHPASSRLSRQFSYPTMVFNPHAQFEELRKNNQYEKMKNIVRKRDLALSGSINPMLTDFGSASEVYQYSGLAHDQTWECPLKIHHAKN